MQKNRLAPTGLKALVALPALAACAAASATTYWCGAGSSGKPPACFKFYEDEAMTAEVSLTPAENDGNTYVVLGSGKMQGSYTVPAGTTWVFGMDGQAVGSRKTYPAFNSNGYNQNTDFGTCTIYGIQVTVLSDGILNWRGVNTFVNCGQPFVFRTSSVGATARGVNLAGTFIAAPGVLVQLKGDWWNGGSVANLTLSGNFSAYKGKFSAAQNATTTTLSLTSASAFGDPSEEMSDYLTVTKNVTLVIDPAATQYATKGIVFSLGAADTAFLKVDANKPLTLIAPISGSAGTLEKTGDGTLTLATSVQTTNVTVGAGTLVVDSTASFAEGTVLKVLNGATVVSRVGSNIPNVTLDLSDGGSFSYDFTVPFNGTSVTTMDYTSLTAEDRATLTKPIAILLSQQIALPQNTGMDLAVARFSASAGFEAADFADGTAKTYGLPNTTFAMSEPVDGIVTLTMAVKPAITRTGGKRYSPLDAQFTYNTSTKEYTTTPVWSDGLAAHPGADYVHANGGETFTKNSWDTGTQTFMGDSLYLTSVWYMKSKKLVLPETTFAGGYIDDGNGSPALHTYAGGPYILASNLGFFGNTDPIRYSLEAQFRGTGTLSLSCRGLSTNPSYVTGDNSQLKGKVVVTHQSSPSGVNESARFEVALGSSLGGAMDAFAADGITISKYSIVRPQQTMTLGAANRGVTIDGFGGFDVQDGKVLTIANPVALAGESGSLIKIGAGALKLDGAVTREGANGIAVDEGWLRAPGENVSTAADVAFAAGTGLEIDVAAVSANGLWLTGPAALTFADSKLKWRLVNTAAAEAAGADFTVAICTVPSGSALSEGDFAYVRSCRNFEVTVRRETLGDGSIRFVADCTPRGFRIVL